MNFSNKEFLQRNSLKREIWLEKPYMNSNPFLSTFFSFVKVDQYSITWLLKFFTGTYAITKGSDDEFDFHLHGYASANLLDDYFLVCCPFVEISVVNQNLLTSDIIFTIENAILQGFCLSVVIEPHYIKAYGKIDLNEHSILINGFDSEEKVFIVKDFFPPQYKYVKREVTYDEFREAFKNRNKKYNLRFIRSREIMRCPSTEDIRNVLYETLSNLVNNNYTVKNPYYPLAYKVYNDKKGAIMDANNIWYGTEVYIGFLQKLDKMPTKFWIMLTDSKRLIYYAVELLEFDSKQAVVLLYKEILDNLKILQNLNIKYAIAKKTSIIEHMKELILITKEKEERVISILLTKLKY